MHVELIINHLLNVCTSASRFAYTYIIFIVCMCVCGFVADKEGMFKRVSC